MAIALKRSTVILISVIVFVVIAAIGTLATVFILNSSNSVAPTKSKAATNNQNPTSSKTETAKSPSDIGLAAANAFDGKNGVYCGNNRCGNQGETWYCINNNNGCVKDNGNFCGGNICPSGTDACVGGTGCANKTDDACLTNGVFDSSKCGEQQTSIAGQAYDQQSGSYCGTTRCGNIGDPYFCQGNSCIPSSAKFCGPNRCGSETKCGPNSGGQMFVCTDKASYCGTNICGGNEQYCDVNNTFQCASTGTSIPTCPSTGAGAGQCQCGGNVCYGNSNICKTATECQDIAPSTSSTPVTTTTTPVVTSTPGAVRPICNGSATDCRCANPDNSISFDCPSGYYNCNPNNPVECVNTSVTSTPATTTTPPVATTTATPGDTSCNVNGDSPTCTCPSGTTRSNYSGTNYCRCNGASSQSSCKCVGNEVQSVDGTGKVTCKSSITSTPATTTTPVPTTAAPVTTTQAPTTASPTSTLQCVHYGTLLKINYDPSIMDNNSNGLCYPKNDNGCASFWPGGHIRYVGTGGVMCECTDGYAFGPKTADGCIKQPAQNSTVQVTESSNTTITLANQPTTFVGTNASAATVVINPNNVQGVSTSKKVLGVSTITFSVTPDSSGNWSYIVPEGLTPGDYKAEVKDAAGNVLETSFFTVSSKIFTSTADKTTPNSKPLPNTGMWDEIILPVLLSLIFIVSGIIFFIIARNRAKRIE